MRTFETIKRDLSKQKEKVAYEQAKLERLQNEYKTAISSLTE